MQGNTSTGPYRIKNKGTGKMKDDTLLKLRNHKLK